MEVVSVVMTEAFLSSSWYRVARLRPQLRDHATLERHRYRGTIWYVLNDPFSRQTHRLTPAAYEFVARMDGRRSVDEIWLEVCAVLDEEAPSQELIIQLLAQLHSADLLASGATVDVEELFDRHAKRERAKLKQQVSNPLSIKIPLWDPDRFLSRTVWMVRPLFGRAGLALWLALVLPAVVLATLYFDELAANWSDQLISAQNLVLTTLVYIVIKAVHEFGHAYATKAYGGAVHETGVMLLVAVPLPYVDASAANRFHAKSQRMTVAAAGIVIELAIAAIALYVWLIVSPGVVRALAYDALIVASVSTIVFNANPLLRFDGYFVLADALEIPNLASRANRYLRHLSDTKLFGAKETPFVATRGERAWFVAYAPAAYIYKLAIAFSLALFLASEYYFLGVALGLWCVYSGVVAPAFKAVKHILRNPGLQRQRRRAIAVSLSLFGAAAAMLLVVPLPMTTYSQGVIWLPETSYVRAGSEGFIQHLAAKSGANVMPGDVLVESQDAVLGAKIAALKGKVEELNAVLVSQEFADRSKAEVARFELVHARAELAREEVRDARLKVRSQTNGTFAIANAADMPGRFAKEGEVLGYVLPEKRNIVRVAVDQDDIELVRNNLVRVSSKLPGYMSETFAIKVLREVPAAKTELPSKVLSAASGGTQTVDPRDPKGLKSLKRVFQYDLELPTEAPQLAFGGRVHVRFEHPPEPAAMQIYRRARQLLLARLYA